MDLNNLENKSIVKSEDFEEIYESEKSFHVYEVNNEDPQETTKEAPNPDNLKPEVIYEFTKKKELVKHIQELKHDSNQDNAPKYSLRIQRDPEIWLTGEVHDSKPPNSTKDGGLSEKQNQNHDQNMDLDLSDDFIFIEERAKLMKELTNLPDRASRQDFIDFLQRKLAQLEPPVPIPATNDVKELNLVDSNFEENKSSSEHEVYETCKSQHSDGFEGPMEFQNTKREDSEIEEDEDIETLIRQRSKS